MKFSTIMATCVIASFSCSSARGQSEPSTEPEPTTLSSDLATTQNSSDLSATPQPQAALESADSVNRNLKDVTNERAGILKFGPVTLLDPVWDQTTKFLEKYGIRLGFAYTIVFQDPSNGSDTAPAAVGGDLDIFGNWRILGKPDGDTNGYLYFQFEERSSIGTSTAPKAIGGEIGSLWSTTNGFNEEPFIVKQLYWEQHFWGDGLLVRLGRLDPTNFYDTNRWQSDSKYFMNQAFSSFPVRAFPGPGVGLNVRLRFNDWLAVSTGVQNSEGNSNTGNLGDFWDDYSPFTAAELAITPTIPKLGRGNYRFTYWYRDASSDEPHDGGFDMSFDQEVGPHLIPFFRYGYSEGTVSNIRNMISTGVGYQGAILSPSDVIGAAFAWGQPSQSGARSQYATELFYRLQVSADNQLTFGYQVIIDPTFSTNTGAVGVFEMRWRVSL